MRTATHNAYTEGLSRVVAHVVGHLDERLDARELAGLACFSTFHFHRIFRGLMGESVGEFVRRMRLERAARELRHGAPVLRVALDAGFESHEAFTRAFRDAFHCPPSEFRRRRAEAFQLPNPTGTHFDPVGKPPRPHFVAPRTDISPEIRRLPSQRLAALRHVGPYWQIGPVFGQVAHWALGHGLELEGLVGVYYDCPETTPPAECRSDACAPVAEGLRIDDERLQEVRLAGGLHAVYTYVGPYSNMGEGWSRFAGEWLPQSGCAPSEAPSFEVYVDDCAKVPVDRLRTELCIPINSPATAGVSGEER